MDRGRGEGGDNFQVFDDENDNINNDKLAVNIVNTQTNYVPSNAADAELQSSTLQGAAAPPMHANLQPPGQLPAPQWQPGPAAAFLMEQPLASSSIPHSSLSGANSFFGTGNVNMHQEPLPVRGPVAGAANLQNSYAHMLQEVQRNMNSSSRSILNQGVMDYGRQVGPTETLFSGPGPSPAMPLGHVQTMGNDGLARFYQRNLQQAISFPTSHAQDHSWLAEQPNPGVGQMLVPDPQLLHIWNARSGRHEPIQVNGALSDHFSQPSSGASFSLAGQSIMPQLSVPFTQTPQGMSMLMQQQVQAPQNTDYPTAQSSNPLRMEHFLMGMGGVPQQVHTRQDPQSFIGAPHPQVDLFGGGDRTDIAAALANSQSAIAELSRSGTNRILHVESLPAPTVSKALAKKTSDLGNFELRLKQRRRYRHENFPAKLYRLLQDAEYQGLQSIISFNPAGTAFAVHDASKFTAEVLPRYFRHSRMASFKRQLSMYGFRRLIHGAEEGFFYHDLFRRGRPDLCEMLKRVTEFEVVPRGTASLTQGAIDGEDEGPEVTNDAAAVARDVSESQEGGGGDVDEGGGEN